MKGLSFKRHSGEGVISSRDKQEFAEVNGTSVSIALSTWTLLAQKRPAPTAKHAGTPTMKRPIASGQGAIGGSTPAAIEIDYPKVVDYACNVQTAPCWSWATKFCPRSGTRIELTGAGYMRKDRGFCGTTYESEGPVTPRFCVGIERWVEQGSQELSRGSVTVKPGVTAGSRYVFGGRKPSHYFWNAVAAF